MTDNLPHDPRCRFCTEIALVAVCREPGYAAFWCGSCGALAIFRDQAAEPAPDGIPSPRTYEEKWTSPVFAGDTGRPGIPPIEEGDPSEGRLPPMTTTAEEFIERLQAILAARASRRSEGT